MVRLQKEEKAIIQMTSIPMKSAQRGKVKNHAEETLQRVASARLLPASLLAHTPSL